MASSVSVKNVQAVIFMW